KVDDSVLARSFGKFPSFQKAKIVRDGRTKKPKGYGFVSFSDPADFTKALREMQGVYVGNRPIKVMRSEYEVCLPPSLNTTYLEFYSQKPNNLRFPCCTAGEFVKRLEIVKQLLSSSAPDKFQCPPTGVPRS
ncbi:hypothetical protein T484DRAFT_1643819, partial [Baffinella frigidus]